MKSLLPLIKKDLKRFFTDKRLLASLFLPGLLIFVLYSLMGTVMNSMYDIDENFEYQVYMENQPEDFDTIFAEFGLKVNVTNIDETHNKEEIKKSITNGDIHILIIFPENFNDLFQTQSITNETPQVEIFYNQDITESYVMFVGLQTLLNEWESQFTNIFDINNSGSQYNLSIKGDQTNPLASMIPMLLLTLLVTGVVSIATEAVAGEKERGTIATLLITPVSRFKIATAKIISIAIPSIASALASFVGLFLSLPNLMGSLDSEMTSFSLGAGEIFGLLLIVIVTVLLFSVLITMISTLAKSVKESQQFATPILLLATLGGFATMFFALPDTYLFFIPILNTSLVITSLFDTTFNMMNLFITVGVNLLVIVLGVFIIAKMFNSEKIIFNK